MKPVLSIIVVSYNTARLLRACLHSVFANTHIPFEVIVVDNASADGSPQMVREEFPQVQLIESASNLGFGRANNLGFERSTGLFIMLLNSDAELMEDTGAELVDFLRRSPEVGAVGPKVFLRDGSRQEKTYGNLPTCRAMLCQNLLLCRIFPNIRSLSGVFIETAWEREMEVGWVSGVCITLRRNAYAAIGGFDPQFFLYAEDLDLCARLRQAGWKIVRVEDYAIRHWCGGSTKTAESALRNAVMQQQNFLKIVDRSSGRLGRFFSRFALGVGLMLRLLVHCGDLWSGRPRPMFEQYKHCLIDLLSFGRKANEVQKCLPVRPVTGVER